MRKSSKGGTPRRAKVQRAKAGRVKAHRAKPGARGTGRFFHIQVRPRTEFVTFRNQDVGARGGIERVAGRRANGTWDTQKWLVGKTQAHLDGKQLAPDTAAATASSRAHAATSRKARSRRRPCAARNWPTSRRRRPPCKSGAEPKRAPRLKIAAHDPENADDPQARQRQIPALFAETKSEDRQAPQSRNLHVTQGRAAARARHSIFQAALMAGTRAKRTSSELAAISASDPIRTCCPLLNQLTGAAKGRTAGFPFRVRLTRHRYAPPQPLR
jgi:hypothetical protein